jgi:hypothetical protein
MDVPVPPPPPPPPALVSIPMPMASADPKGPKNDFFYKYWDKFTAKKKSLKFAPPPSLDRDEEGQPSHYPETNDEGVGSRSVQPLV